MHLYDIFRPLLGCVGPELSHNITLTALASGLGPRLKVAPDPSLAIQLWGRDFINPLGLAAGFDKNARVIGPVLDMGFGFTEIGTVTPKAQPGNPKPRIFRLKEDKAVINRLGFNNLGVDGAEANLMRWREKQNQGPNPGLVGINIGKNKDATDGAADYGFCAGKLGGYADYLVINVSSPNTPGLRALQSAAALEEILGAVGDALADAELAGGKGIPVLVKISPDLGDGDLADIVAMACGGQMDGLVISNTTLDRPKSLQSAHRPQQGGLSGKPLFEPSTQLLGAVWRETEGKIPLIGVGGIASAEDAYAKIRAGASLISLYTGLVYQGPKLVEEILTGLVARLTRDGYGRIQDAVGADNL
ncbi:MAG: quinone-dependent dihydroorotate dehydrogenase [Rhodospirillales bacterium]|jgi:dihydroorotate dehydrogenase|nr:quinone-dependent dihydroorotate dehydrogenase [Rhodospirillales bacterium]MBT5075821.1 quinone-dependent dihydroorotate dehydrogenase [Rhodospirillales bacterium]MBT5113878.1 quinone-dependent dihydroorotate dehydrogenase [Rhodospirillales bacterium]MBT5672406.1 quinone-dependent dihydroorotate dehydrogenase [Rhodospirillales bacterium]MBT6185925.1 quinone-dependent dihydroorotate dehydrogenase [Rhodospirillales bacterium]